MEHTQIKSIEDFINVIIEQSKEVLRIIGKELSTEDILDRRQEEINKAERVYNNIGKTVGSKDSLTNPIKKIIGIGLYNNSFIVYFKYSKGRRINFEEFKNFNI